MPNLPLSMLSLLGTIPTSPLSSSNSGKDNNGGDSFDSLLALGSSDAGANAANSTERNEPDTADRDSKDTQAQAVPPLSSPVVLAPRDPAPAPAAEQDYSPVVQQSSPDDRTALPPSTTTKPSAQNTSDDAKANAVQPAKTAADGKTDVLKSNAKDTSSADQADDAEQDTGGIKKQLQSLSQLLSQLFNMLTGGAQPAAALQANSTQAAPANTDATAGAQATNAAASLNADLKAIVVTPEPALFTASSSALVVGGAAATLLSANSNDQTGTQKTESAQALLGDINQLLQKIQNFLPSSQSQTAAAATVSAQAQTSSDSSLPDLADSLKAASTALQQMLNGTPATAGAQTAAAPAAQASTLATAAAGTEQMLASAITQAKTLLNAQKSAAAQPAKTQSKDPSLEVNALDVAQQANAAAHKVAVAPTNPAQPADTSLAVQPNKADIQQVQFINMSQTTAAPAQASTDSGTNSNQGGNDGNGLMAAAGVQSTGPAQASTGADAPSFSKIMSQVNPGMIADQVAVQIKTAAKDGSSKIHISLDPEELGKLEIKLNVGADGKTGVTVTADNENTLDLLQRDSSALQRALSDAGLHTDGGSLNFNLRGGQQEHQQGQAQAAMTYQKAAPEEDEAVAQVVTRNYVVNVTEGLDIRI